MTAENVIIVAPPPAAPVQSSPPDDADVLLRIVDRMRDYRSCITKDGTCYNNQGQIIGYIEGGESAGSVEMAFLGDIQEAVSGNWNIRDDSETVVGEIDPGKATVIDAKGSTVAELTNAGECTGHAGTFIGQFYGFSFNEMKIIGLYLMLIDPGMMNEIEG